MQAHPELFPDPTNYTYDQWLWASFTFQTRAYLISPHTQTRMGKMSRRRSSALLFLFRRLVDPRYRDQLSYVMVPLFDMLDHSSVIAVEDKVRARAPSPASRGLAG